MLIYDGSLPFNKTFSSLQESADEGCVLCRFIWSSIVNDPALTKEVLESKEFAEGSIRLAVRKIQGELTLIPIIEQKGRPPFQAEEIRFELVGCSEVDVMGMFKTRHIKGNAKCLLK